MLLIVIHQNDEENVLVLKIDNLKYLYFAKKKTQVLELLHYTMGLVYSTTKKNCSFFSLFQSANEF